MLIGDHVFASKMKFSITLHKSKSESSSMGCRWDACDFFFLVGNICEFYIYTASVIK